jgi:hypothetical protein
MKKYISLLILSALLILTYPGITHAQLSINLGPTIGLTSPTGDYGGDPSEFYTGSKYGLKPGINFGAMGNLSLGPLYFNLSIIYSPLSNSGAADVTHSGSTVDISQHLLTIGLGSQFGFGVPMSPVKPYLGLELLYSSISGDATFQGTSNVPSSTIDMETATRFGLGLDGGVKIKLMSTQFDLSLRYNMINLFHKSYDGSPSGDRIEAYKYLNDDSDPNYSTASNDKHPINSNRMIATVQFQLAVFFGL